jgi:hypothetical protein
MFEKGTARRVWKYTVNMPDAHGRSSVDLPIGGRVISAGLQSDQFVVWAIVPAHPDTNELWTQQLLIVNTNTPFYLPGKANFMGTLTTANGIVWHVWSKE